MPDMNIKLITGLGNPDEKYARTRHNTGWLAIEYLAGTWGLTAPQEQKKFYGKICRGSLDGQEIILLEPTTYMNDSGLAVAAVANFYQIDINHDFLLIYDDLDIVFGEYKFVRRPPRTHNGVTSVQQHVHSTDFYQVRIGTDARGRERTIRGLDYVLTQFSPEELKTLQSGIFPAVAREVRSWL